MERQGQDSVEALQRLLRLAAANLGRDEATFDAEITRVLVSFAAEIAAGEVQRLAWFVALAGVLGAMLAEEIARDEDDADAARALRALELALEHAVGA
jgi:hypothetical protein